MTVASPAPLVGPPTDATFALTDHHGRPVTDSDYRGRFMLIYFGFTYCPDICPTDLQNIGLALDQLGAAGDKVQPLFVTVDPERDTAAHLAQYVQMFHPRLIGLTGDAAAIRAAADAYKVYYAKVPNERGDEYTVDHTAFTYLIGADGKYLGFLPPGTAPERIADILRQQTALIP